MAKQISYEKFSPFYDAVMGNGKKSSNRIKDLLIKFHPSCRSILEIACGTGEILDGLKKDYIVEGLDLSPGMLKVAKKKLPKVPLHLSDMTDFDLKKKFDAVICVYDSINHLVKFSDWKKVFTHASAHLNDHGVFIFDVNTIFKLKKFAKMPIWVKEFDKNYLHMKVTCDRDGLSEWDIKVFEHLPNNLYRPHEEVILEKGFSTKVIKDALKLRF